MGDAIDMVERRAEVFARMSALKEEAGILTEIFADKVSQQYFSVLQGESLGTLA